MKKILIIVLSLFLCLSVHAQERQHYDVIYLKNGSEFRGELLEYDTDQVTIKALGGKKLTFQQSQIKKIVQEPFNNTIEKPRKPYQFKEVGIYKALFGSFTSGTFAWDSDFASGFGFKGVVGYQINRWFGAGIGAGIENYYLNEGETVYPVFAEVRGYLTNKNVAPYYSVSGGYSFTIVNEEAGISDASGGYLFHPALGIRFGGAPNVNATLDVGVQIQKATFIREITSWRGSETLENRMTYQRLSIRLGLLF